MLVLCALLFFVYKMTVGSQTKLDSQQVFEAVNAHLVSLRAGITEPVRVREEALAGKLGVSRTPVREALIRLESSGVINMQPGRGAVLMPLTDSDYLEWLQIREQLEGVATREAALNASKRDVDRLRAFFALFQADSLGEAEDVEYAKANVFFHKEIIRLSGNGLLARIWESFGHLQTSFRRRTIAQLHRRGDSLRQHLEIIDAIEARDAERAELLARQHVKHLITAVKNADSPT